MDIMTILFIILVLLIILWLIYKYRQFEKPVFFIFDDKKNYNPDDWVMYRLGDMVASKYHLGPGTEQRDDDEGEALHLRDYPNTIASHYMRMTRKGFDYEILDKIVKAYPLNQIPKKDELVVHLRIGDVLEYDEHSVDEFLANYIPSPFGKGVYAQPLQHYENHLKNIEEW